MSFTVQTVLVHALYCTNCISSCTLLYKLLVHALYCTNCVSYCTLLYKLY